MYQIKKVRNEWQVVNTATGVVQSAWKQMMDALRVAAALNLSLETR